MYSGEEDLGLSFCYGLATRILKTGLVCYEHIGPFTLLGTAAHEPSSPAQLSPGADW